MESFSLSTQTQLEASKDKEEMNIETNHNLEAQEPAVLLTEAERTIQLLMQAADNLRQQLTEKDTQISFLQDQYKAASTYVGDLRSENAQLAASNATLQSQVSAGLALIRNTFEKRVAWLEDDAKAWRQTAEFLREKDKLTNDDVRKRASLLGVREAEMQVLRAERAEWRVRELEEHLSRVIAEGGGHLQAPDNASSPPPSH
ncbi:hypothetical protein BDZ89DRAFT_1069234 [Hymenopellis radicata]|nr:hypothetical protein BDZ89DRAFT_1069234 [Hymenopellis radicata]